jgi:Flp pilus assembly protein TadD
VKKKMIVFFLVVVCLHAVSMSQTKNSAVDWLKSANTKLEREDYQGAIADCTKAIKLKPDDAVAYFIRGSSYVELRQKSKALKDFMSAIELGYLVPQEILDLCK